MGLFCTLRRVFCHARGVVSLAWHMSCGGSIFDFEKEKEEKEGERVGTLLPEPQNCRHLHVLAFSTLLPDANKVKNTGHAHFT